MTKTYSNSDLMKIAFEEHQKCELYPRVGAVIAENGIVISTGFRGEVDLLHAERIAIQKLEGHDLSNAILLTTLEPCVGIHDSQIQPCTDLIIESGLTKVVIGILDPNGSIYSQGYEKLLAQGISVSFFDKKLQKNIDETTFKYGDVQRIVGSGKRRVPVVHGGTNLTVQFSKTDTRTIDIRWSTLQLRHGIVDLHSGKDAVRVASGTRNFDEITDPMVFRFPKHCSRMSEGMISIVHPADATFCVLIKLLEIYEKDVLFQWQVRNIS